MAGLLFAPLYSCRLLLLWNANRPPPPSASLMSCCESPFVGLLGIVFAFDLLQIHDVVLILSYACFQVQATKQDMFWLM